MTDKRKRPLLTLTTWQQPSASRSASNQFEIKDNTLPSDTDAWAAQIMAAADKFLLSRGRSRPRGGRK